MLTGAVSNHRMIRHTCITRLTASPLCRDDNVNRATSLAALDLAVSEPLCIRILCVAMWCSRSTLRRNRVWKRNVLHRHTNHTTTAVIVETVVAAIEEV